MIQPYSTTALAATLTGTVHSHAHEQLARAAYGELAAVLPF